MVYDGTRGQSLDGVTNQRCEDIRPSGSMLLCLRDAKRKAKRKAKGKRRG